MRKTIGLVIMLVTIMTVNVSCQNLESKERSGKQHINNINQKLKSELDLDEKQEISWDEIYVKYRARFNDLRADDAIGREVKREKAKNLFEEMDKEVLTILNDDQQKEYATLVKENRGKAKEKHKKRQTGNSAQNKGQSKGQSIKNELSLSEDQSEKWDIINGDYRIRMQELKKSNDVSNDSTRNDIANLMGEKDAEILAILDSSQQASYLQIVDERRSQAKERKGKGQ